MELNMMEIGKTIKKKEKIDVIYFEDILNILYKITILLLKLLKF